MNAEQFEQAHLDHLDRLSGASEPDVEQEDAMEPRDYLMAYSKEPSTLENVVAFLIVVCVCFGYCYWLLSSF